MPFWLKHCIRVMISKEEGVYLNKYSILFNIFSLCLFLRDKLIPESMIRNIIYQVLQGLAFIHKHGESGFLIGCRKWCKIIISN